jgi:hypothetical protein
MALLGLVRLLHPGGPKILSIRPRGRFAPSTPRGTQTRRCPTGHMARRRPADDRSGPERVSNARGRRRVRRGALPERLSRVARGHRSGTDARWRWPRTYTPWEYARIALRRDLGRCYPLRALGAGDVRGRRQQASWRGAAAGRPASSKGRRSDVRPPTRHDPGPWPAAPVHTRQTPNAGPIDRMDAKQVWRAALGELQVSLSPANYETWLRDTRLVDVDDQRFRIAVPNGFAKDWLETRYRSLISQTLARIVGYSVQVEFVIGPAPADAAPTGGVDGRAVPIPAGDPHRRRGRRHQPQPALHLRELHRRIGQPPRSRGKPVCGRTSGSRV